MRAVCSGFRWRPGISHSPGAQPRDAGPPLIDAIPELNVTPGGESQGETENVSQDSSVATEATESSLSRPRSPSRIRTGTPSRAEDFKSESRRPRFTGPGKSSAGLHAK
jgi:hypothetical protein